jgi:hypothetical protein
MHFLIIIFFDSFVYRIRYEPQELTDGNRADSPEDVDEEPAEDNQSVVENLSEASSQFSREEEQKTRSASDTSLTMRSTESGSTNQQKQSSKQNPLSQLKSKIQEKGSRDSSEQDRGSLRSKKKPFLYLGTKSKSFAEDTRPSHSRSQSDSRKMGEKSKSQSSLSKYIDNFKQKKRSASARSVRPGSSSEEYTSKEKDKLSEKDGELQVNTESGNMSKNEDEATRDENEEVDPAHETSSYFQSFPSESSVVLNEQSASQLAIPDPSQPFLGGSDPDLLTTQIPPSPPPVTPPPPPTADLTQQPTLLSSPEIGDSKEDSTCLELLDAALAKWHEDHPDQSPPSPRSSIRPPDGEKEHTLLNHLSTRVRRISMSKALSSPSIEGTLGIGSASGGSTRDHSFFDHFRRTTSGSDVSSGVETRSVRSRSPSPSGGREGPRSFSPTRSLRRRREMSPASSLRRGMSVAGSTPMSREGSVMGDSVNSKESRNGDMIAKENEDGEAHIRTDSGSNNIEQESVGNEELRAEQDEHERANVAEVGNEEGKKDVKSSESEKISEASEGTEEGERVVLTEEEDRHIEHDNQAKTESDGERSIEKVIAADDVQAEEDKDVKSNETSETVEKVNENSPIEEKSGDTDLNAVTET